MEKDHAELGCCGYDELAEKPPTTQPFRPWKIKTTNVWRNTEAGITRRINTSMGSSKMPYPVINVVKGQ